MSIKSCSCICIQKQFTKSYFPGNATMNINRLKNLCSAIFKKINVGIQLDYKQ